MTWQRHEEFSHRQRAAARGTEPRRGDPMCRLWWHRSRWIRLFLPPNPSLTPLSLSPQVIALSKRSKEAETAFLSVYKQFLGAPGKQSGGDLAA